MPVTEDRDHHGRRAGGRLRGDVLVLPTGAVVTVLRKLGGDSWEVLLNKDESGDYPQGATLHMTTDLLTRATLVDPATGSARVA